MPRKPCGCVTCRLTRADGWWRARALLFIRVTVPTAVVDTAMAGCAARSGSACGSGHGLFGHHGGSSAGIYDGTDGLGAGSAGYATHLGSAQRSGRRSPLWPVDLRAVRLQHRGEALALVQMLNKIRCGSAAATVAVVCGIGRDRALR